MLADGRIRIVAREIQRGADERIHAAEDRFDRQQLWEAVRHACHAIAAVADMEAWELSGADRNRRVRYIVSELEFALEAARRARVVLDWTADREYHDF